MANNTFLNSLRKNDVEAQVEFTSKGPGSPVIDLSVKKDSVLVYVLNFFGILADRCGSVVVMGRDYDTKGPSLTLGCDLLSCK